METEELMAIPCVGGNLHFWGLLEVGSCVRVFVLTCLGYLDDLATTCFESEKTLESHMKHLHLQALTDLIPVVKYLSPPSCLFLLCLQTAISSPES